MNSVLAAAGSPIGMSTTRVIDPAGSAANSDLPSRATVQAWSAAASRSGRASRRMALESKSMA